MPVDLASLADQHRLLFKIPLEPLLGKRFQPTGFPSLGAATFQTTEGRSLLVESAQSMANRLESTIWDDVAHDLKPAVRGLSHVRITRKGAFLSDTVLESHRLNSPYLLANSDPTFSNQLREELGVMDTGPIDRALLAKVLLKYDIGSLIHGVFLAKKELAGGRLRVARALSAFIEADGVEVAPSGGVKNDHVNPQGIAKDGFGNVPFARDEYTAEEIMLYVNLDLAQIRGYGLGEDAETLMLLLSLYKLRVLVDQPMRLRTLCDLHVEKSHEISAFVPKEWALPKCANLETDLKTAIARCRSAMEVTEVAYEDELKKKADAKSSASEND